MKPFPEQAFWGFFANTYVFLLGTWLVFFPPALHARPNPTQDSLLSVILAPEYTEDIFKAKANALSLYNQLNEKFAFDLYDTLLVQARRTPKNVGEVYVQHVYLDHLLVSRQFEEAIVLGQEMLDKEFALPSALRISILNYLGALYASKGLMSLGLENFMLSLQEAEAAAEEQLIATALTNLQFMLLRSGNYEKAYEFGKRSRRLAHKHSGDDANRSISYTEMRLGQTAHKMNMPDSAVVHFEAAISYGKQQPYHLQTMSAYSTYLDFLSETGDLAKGKEILQELEKLAQVNTPYQTWVSAFYCSAKAKYLLKSGNPEAALQTFQQLHYDSTHTSYNTFTRLRQDIYHQLGDHEKVQELNQGLLAHLDQQVKQRDEQLFQWLEAKLEASRISQENQELKSTLQMQQWWTQVILGFAALLFIGGVVLTGYVQKVNKLNQTLGERNQAILQKNNELEQLTYSTTHDIKEPVNNVLSFSQLLAARHTNALPEEGRKLLKVIETSSQNLKEVVSGLHEYLTVGKMGTFEPVEMTELVSSVLTSLEKLIHDTQAEIHLGTLPTVCGKSVELKKLFQNLLTNALHYRHPDRVPNISIGYLSMGDFHQFSVKDNGVGIPTAYHKKIFDLFQVLQEKRETLGKGIGLASSKKIVELHQGRIWVESEPGKGSTFFFTLKKNLQA